MKMMATETTEEYKERVQSFLDLYTDACISAVTKMKELEAILAELEEEDV